MVGAATAQALALKEIASSIVLIDVAEDLVKGQAMDINHATAFTDGVQVRAGDYSDIQEDDIVVITCGVPQKPGQPRLELLATNAGIIRDVVGKVMAQGRPVFIVMVTNPVDVLTEVALKASGLPKERVFGTGTSLDTARLRVMLANALQVSQQMVEGFVLGEHGDSSFLALSQVRVGGMPVEQFPGFKPEMTATLEQDIRNTVYQIIEAKKATYFGIGSVVARIVEALLHDAPVVLPTCSLTQGEYGLHDIVIGLPSLVSSHGVRIIDSYPLSDDERQRLQASADIIAQASAGI